MDRQKAPLLRLDKAWTAFKDSYAGLSDADMLGPRVKAEWSVRDILAHVTTWEGEALKYLPLIADGTRPPRYSTQYGGIDAFNRLTTDLKRPLPLSAILSHLDSTHLRLLDYLQSLPDDLFSLNSRFLRRLRLDTYAHYPKHTAAILHWRDTHGL